MIVTELLIGSTVYVFYSFYRCVVKRNSEIDSLVPAGVALHLAQRRMRAATVIQGAWRAKIKMQNRSRAAVKIQTAFRARRRQAVQLQQQSASVFSSFYRYIVTLVQAGVDEIQRIGHGHLARQQRRAAAASVIQRAWRLSKIQRDGRELQLENAVQIQQLIGLRASTLTA